MSGSPLRSPGGASDAPPRAHIPTHIRTHFRRAGPDDAEAVARVHFEAAQQAYRDILPDEAMVGMTYQRRLALWGGLLGGPGKVPRVELAVEKRGAEADEVVAFAWWRDVRDPDAGFDGEIIALYVLPERQRRGLGRRLIGHTAASMAGAGLESCYLWVFEEHQAARRFYEALGGRRTDRGWEALGELRVPIVAYAWKPLDRLMAQGDSPARAAAP